MYPSLVRVTEMPADVFGRLSDVIVFDIGIPTYDVASSHRCLYDSNNIIDNALVTCARVVGCLSLPVALIVVVVFDVFFREFFGVCSGVTGFMLTVFWITFCIMPASSSTVFIIRYGPS